MVQMIYCCVKFKSLLPPMSRQSNQCRLCIHASKYLMCAPVSALPAEPLYLRMSSGSHIMGLLQEGGVHIFKLANTEKEKRAKIHIDTRPQP